MAKTPPLEHVPISEWAAVIFLEWSKASHLWLIPPAAAEASLASLPAAMRQGLNHESVAEMLSAGVASSFTHANPDTGAAHLWPDKYMGSNGNLVLGLAWAGFRTGNRRAAGWGPAKTLAFVNDRISQAFPDAIAFLNLPKEAFAGSHPFVAHAIASFVSQAKADLEARDIALAAPAPDARAPRSRL